MSRLRERSYLMFDAIEPGDRARLTENVYRHGRLVARKGAVVTVEDFSDAGRRGVEATVRTEMGARIYGVSAGALS